VAGLPPNGLDMRRPAMWHRPIIAHRRPTDSMKPLNCGFGLRPVQTASRSQNTARVGVTAHEVPGPTSSTRRNFEIFPFVLERNPSIAGLEVTYQTLILLRVNTALGAVMPTAKEYRFQAKECRELAHAANEANKLNYGAHQTECRERDQAAGCRLRSSSTLRPP
jgi:hypothetical protein